jgi:O-antigen ligase
MIVPVMPLKSNVRGIPMAPDFIIGGLLIFTGLLIFATDFKNTFDNIKKLMKSRYMAILSVLIVLFGMLSVVSLSYAGNKIYTISETMRFAEYVLIFYFILLYCGKREIKNICILLLLTFLAAGFYGLVQFALGTSEFRNYEIILGRGRVYSTFVNPNYWGAAVNLVIFVPICVILEKKGYSKGYKAASIAYFIVMFANLILCLTKGSWLGFVLGAVIIFIIRYRRGLIYLAAGGGAVACISNFREYFIYAVSSRSHSLSTRVTLWKTGLKMFQEHMLTGVGNGNYNYYYSQYVERYPELQTGGEAYTVHNSYLKMFAELGIFGGLGFMAIYLMLAGFAIKVYRNSKGTLKILSLALIGFWCAYLFQNFFNNLMFIPQLNVFVWIVSAALYKYYILDNEERA